MKQPTPNETNRNRPLIDELDGRPRLPELPVLRALVPAGVAVAAARDEGPTPRLFPEEEAVVAGAPALRRHEYAVGRDCARAALRELGVESVPIPTRSDRAPIWPTGIVGSITHTSGLTAAAAGRREQVAALGVDIETRAQRMNERLDRFIRTAGEREREPLERLAAYDGLRVVFSAKECVHKCVAPTSGITLGFHDVEVDLDVAGGVFRVRLTGRSRPGLPELEDLVGRFVVTPEYVMTAAVLSAAD